MHTILDLDLDFFVWPVARDRAEDEPRLDENEFTSNSEEQVRHFLEFRISSTCNHRRARRYAAVPKPNVWIASALALE